jgi:hypothetical protein
MDKWEAYFYYDESSPTALRWATEIRTGRYNNVVLVSAGGVAGSNGKAKSPQVKLAGKLIFVHRIVWELHNGEIPEGLYVDHIDGDHLNNRIGNLRLVTHKVNARNARMYRTNTSGVAGVSFDTRESRWLAQWRDIEGVPRKKGFPVAKLGYDEAFEAAVQYRRQVIEELNNLGAGYTKRHGEEVRV